jgi:hypothetical protein
MSLSPSYTPLVSIIHLYLILTCPYYMFQQLPVISYYYLHQEIPA